MRDLAIIIIIVAAAAAAVRLAHADPASTKAPPATTAPSLPPRVSLSSIPVASGPAFKPLPSRWWKRARPCPAGARLKQEKNDTRSPRASAWTVAWVCRDGAGRDHGPGVALFADGQRYEEGWQRRGQSHGLRRVWDTDGAQVESVTFVDHVRQGPATSWSGGELVEAGSYLDDERHGLWTERAGDNVVLRGHYDRGAAIGTWIGTREGVATAIITGELAGSWTDGVSRVFGDGGELTFERHLRGGAGTATGWNLAGVRLAEYTCGPGGVVIEARFHDDRGVLQRRWVGATETLLDGAGKHLAISDDQRQRLNGARDACGPNITWLEQYPPSYNAAFNLPP